jgi:superfamily II RNA helicase
VAAFPVFSANYMYLSVSTCIAYDQIVVTDLHLAALIISGELCKPEIPHCVMFLLSCFVTSLLTGAWIEQFVMR